MRKVEINKSLQGDGVSGRLRVEHSGEFHFAEKYAAHIILATGGNVFNPYIESVGFLATEDVHCPYIGLRGLRDLHYHPNFIGPHSILRNLGRQARVAAISIVSDVRAIPQCAFWNCRSEQLEQPPQAQQQLLTSL